MKARVTVTLKRGVLDPQGKAIEGALASLGIEGVMGVRQGKVFDLELGSSDPEAARSTLEAACERLLANTVVETFGITIEEVDQVPPAALPAPEPVEEFSAAGEPAAPAATPASGDAGAAADAEMPAEGRP